MTKERKLAIEMWQDIRGKIIALDHEIGHAAIIKYKNEFCERHDLYWVLNCWFCQYIKTRYTFGCMRCPLVRCTNGHYARALDEARDKNERVEACDAIIKALGGKA